MIVTKKNVQFNTIHLSNKQVGVTLTLAANGFMLTAGYSELDSNLMHDIPHQEAEKFFDVFYNNYLTRIVNKIVESDSIVYKADKDQGLNQYVFGNSTTLIVILDTPGKAQLTVESASGLDISQMTSVERDVNEIVDEIKEMTKGNFDRFFRQ